MGSTPFEKPGKPNAKNPVFFPDFIGIRDKRLCFQKVCHTLDVDLGRDELGENAHKEAHGLDHVPGIGHEHRECTDVTLGDISSLPQNDRDRGGRSEIHKAQKEAVKPRGADGFFIHRFGLAAKSFRHFRLDGE